MVAPRTTQRASRRRSRRWSSSTTVPSAIVVVRSGQFGDATFTFGTTELGGTKPVTTKDHARVGSVTKTMTATIILQLVQEGRLTLDDPVSKYVTNVPDGDNITIAQLLDMRSGLYNYTDDPEFLAGYRCRPTAGVDAARVARHRLRPPGGLPAWFQLPLHQHQLHPARDDHGAAHRADRQRAVRTTTLHAARHGRHLPARPRGLLDGGAVRPRLPLRQLRAKRSRPSNRRRPRPARCSRRTSATRTRRGAGPPVR